MTDDQYRKLRKRIRRLEQRSKTATLLSARRLRREVGRRRQLEEGLRTALRVLTVIAVALLIFKACG